MFNIMLDPLPKEYNGFTIDADFQIGIQIIQILEDEDLSQQERIETSLSLLFPNEDENGTPILLPDFQTAKDGLIWFLTGWNHDKRVSGDKTKVTDYDIDQWRIYSAFRTQYGINLNTDKLHFWEFMGLLSTLDECAYTRIIDIRAKKLTKSMSKEEKEAYRKLKRVYALEESGKSSIEYTDEQKAAIDEYDKMIAEQKKIAEKKKLAEAAFKEMARRA